MIRRQFTKFRRLPRLRSLPRVPVRLAIETLEGRTVPSTVNWVNSSGGDWAVASNWDSGAVPGPNDDVVIDVPGNVTVTHTVGDDVVNSVTCTDTLAVSGGSLSLSTTSQVTNLTLAGGVLSARNHLNIDGVFAWSAGTLGGTAVTVANRLLMTGPDVKTLRFDVLEISSEGSIDGGALVLLTSSVQNDADSTLTITHGTFDNGDAFNYGGFVNFGYTRIYGGFGVGDDLVNSGTIEVYSGGLGAGYIRSHFENTGTIQIWNGGFGFYGSWFETSGPISGYGDVNVTCDEGISIANTFHMEGNATFTGWTFGASSDDFYVGGTLTFNDDAFGFANSIVHARNLVANGAILSGDGFGGSFVDVTLDIILRTDYITRTTIANSSIQANRFINFANLYVTGSTIQVLSFENESSLQTDALSVISTSEWFQNDGGFEAEGTVQGDFTNAGYLYVLNLGFSDPFIITGNYYQTPTGHLDLPLGQPNGLSPAPLQIGGDARFGGTINVGIDTLRAQQGDVYQAIAVGGATIGDFNHYMLPPLDNNLVLVPVYDGSNLTFVVEQGG